jgi:hypothetical protein
VQHYYAFAALRRATSVKKAEPSLQSVHLLCLLRVRRPGEASTGAQMGERCRVSRLALEALDELLVAGVFALQDLKRPVAVERLVLGQVDLARLPPTSLIRT